MVTMKRLLPLVAVLWLASMGLAGEQATKEEAKQDKQRKQNSQHVKDNVVGAAVVTTYSSGIRTSELMGMEVRNAEGEELGEITDLVMDRFGQICYAAMSRGGILGVGDKLFAVPFCCATIQADNDDDDEHYVLFDVDEKKLEDSPGFDQENWPAVGTASYWLTIDKHFEDDVKRNQKRQHKEDKKAERQARSNKNTSSNR